MQLHHVALFVGDADRSIPFYRDGLGLAVLVDREFDGPWPTLFDVAATRLRAVIMGDPDHPDAGQVELVTFAQPLPEGPPAPPVVTASVMPSFLVDLDEVLPVLERLGGTDVRRTVLRNGYGVATLRDPEGILVELMGRRREVST